MQFGQLKRRTFITLLGGAAATWPLVARAQRPPKLPTIGFLGSATPLAWSQWVAAFAQRLRELGWIEGRTIAIEYRWAEGRNERYADIAAEFGRAAHRGKQGGGASREWVEEAVRSHCRLLGTRRALSADG
jgi:hypothetical protein